MKLEAHLTLKDVKELLANQLESIYGHKVEDIEIHVGAVDGITATGGITATVRLGDKIGPMITFPQYNNFPPSTMLTKDTTISTTKSWE